MKLILFWLRRDLRLEDNAGLYEAFKVAEQNGYQVQPLFIFDKNILDRLDNSNDKRVPFIHQQISNLSNTLEMHKSHVWVFYGDPIDVYRDLIQKYNLHGVYCNHDYEPYAIKRDSAVSELCRASSIQFQSFKDQVVFEKSEILTGAQTPYTVYTPYKRKWLEMIDDFYLKSYPSEKYFHFLHKGRQQNKSIPLKVLGYKVVPQDFYPSTEIDDALLKSYSKNRDYPAMAATSRLGLHLRFGTLSVRQLARLAEKKSEVWLSELIWREFFMQILFHYPHVVKESFRKQYEKVAWRDNKTEFERWCNGETGYPIVDAGMRELVTTGHMHNRVRMIVASFLTKHLLMHWLSGERFFAKHLLDYDLAANNGNWQWAAGTGCDAAPYFRIFNPESQTQKFDPKHEYIKKWVPEYLSARYPKPMVDHKEARERALSAFKLALK